MSTLKLAANPLQHSLEEDQPLDSGEAGFVAAGPAIRRLLKQVAIVGAHLRIAAIEGESGSGKYTIARLLYDRYTTRHPEISEWGFKRCDAREWLLSHTDPQSLAGFIFLDRVDLLAAPGQALLLRILIDLEFRPAGALVVLASTEAPLRELARNGQFLSELATRLTTVRLVVPPLRERKDDIVPLAKVFLDRISGRYHLPPVVLSSGAVTRLMEHQWPGNVRELSSILESAVIECCNGIIRAEDLAIPGVDHPAAVPLRTSELLNLDAVIRNHIVRVLESNHGNKLRTARQLGVSRSTLYRLLDKSPSFFD